MSFLASFIPPFATSLGYVLGTGLGLITLLVPVLYLLGIIGEQAKALKNDPSNKQA